MLSCFLLFLPAVKTVAADHNIMGIGIGLGNSGAAEKHTVPYIVHPCHGLLGRLDGAAAGPFA